MREQTFEDILCMIKMLQRILFDAIICRIRKIKTSHF